MGSEKGSPVAEIPSELEDLTSRIRRGTGVRLIALSTFLAIITGARWGWGLPLPTNIHILTAVWIAISLLYSMLVSREKRVEVIRTAYSRYFLLEMLVLTFLLYFLGLAGWMGAVFYVFPIIYANSILGKREGRVITLVAILFYLFPVLLDYYAVLTHRKIFATFDLGPYRDTPFVPVSSLVVVWVFVFVGYTSSVFSEMLRQRNRELMRRTEELERTQEELLRRERLAAMGQMAAGVAHDFNNLLAVILGNAQLLERGVDRYEAKEIKDRLAIIARTAKEGGETVRRLQHFTPRKRPGPDFAAIDLNEIILAAIESTSPRWKDESEARGTSIRISQDLKSLPPIMGNRSELMEVLTNLIFNALDAMPDGGEIRVSTEARDGKVYLCFADTGKGVPDDVREKVFEPFFTTKGPQSSGLGLAVSYGIVRRHQGTIELLSSVGEGTTFTIGLPAHGEIPLRSEAPEGKEEVPSRKILVIDDEEGVRDVLGKILQDEGHRVVIAGRSKEGLERFPQGNFDLVITDLGMPEMSGWELTKRIKDIDRKVPVGLTTGWAPEDIQEKMKEAGVDFVLSKPFDSEEVIGKVRSVLASSASGPRRR